MRLLRRVAAPIVLSLLMSGCFGYRLIRPDEIEVPNYEPREVPVPSECEGLARRAAGGGAAQLSEREGKQLEFCQHQQILRAQEEEAAARRLEAHAAAASFALQVTGFLLGGTIAVLAWLF